TGILTGLFVAGQASQAVAICAGVTAALTALVLVVFARLFLLAMNGGELNVENHWGGLGGRIGGGGGAGAGGWCLSGGRSGGLAVFSGHALVERQADAEAARTSELQKKVDELTQAAQQKKAAPAEQVASPKPEESAKQIEELKKLISAVDANTQASLTKITAR